MSGDASGAQASTPRALAVSTRVAGDDDAAELVRMHLAAQQAIAAMPKGVPLVEELTRGPDEEAVASDFASQIEDAGAELLVGCLGEVAVGYASLVPDGSRGRITELWVDPQARQIGVGTALLVALRQAASRRNMTGIDSVALPGDRNTKNFFEDHSMVARAIVVGTSEL